MPEQITINTGEKAKVPESRPRVIVGKRSSRLIGTVQPFPRPDNISRLKVVATE
jgi:hypothetical protein